MRSFGLSLVSGLSLASAIAAHSGPHHNHGKRAHPGRLARAWGRRDAPDSSSGSPTPTASDDASATTFLSVVPDGVTGPITISNTAAADPQATAVAVGADRGDTSPLPTCQAMAQFGESCDPTTTDCCSVGTTCVSNICQRICGISTLEAYCDASSPCDSTKGYTCTKSRCRPPAGATRVGLGAACDQGGANTLFCIPGKGICVSGTCMACTQHS
ncbi:hypothetical protein RQP46_001082 [Phenoliferia psychrophenolica]